MEQSQENRCLHTAVFIIQHEAQLSKAGSADSSDKSPSGNAEYGLL